MDYKEFLTAVYTKTLRLSFSSLVHLDKSPRHFVDYYTMPFNVTPAIAFGSLLHCLVLEPETFGERYAIAPSVDRRTKAGRAAYQSFLDSCEGLTIITEAQHLQAINAIEGLKRCKPAMALLRSATEIEERLAFEHKGLTIKGIRDLASPDFVCDLKSTADASPRGFGYSVRKFAYNMQAAIYTYECGRPYWIIALEKNGNCAVYELGKRQIDLGLEMFERLVMKYKRCALLDGWRESYGFDQPEGVYLID